MGHSMMHSHHGGAARGDTASCGQPWQSAFFLPVPMAVFGALIAFMFGMTLGMMRGSKRATESSGYGHKHWMGHEGQGKWAGKWGEAKPWMKGGTPHHHHHGSGSPACRCGEPPADVASKETGSTD